MLLTAARGLFRQPAFALAAAGTLALGIAAPAALFSGINAALLRPLPYPRAQDIYTVRTYFPDGRFTSGLVGAEELGTLGQFHDAAVNVTNLMLARGTDRAREMAVRAALGASRRRIFLQLVTESMLLSVVGGVAGIDAAYEGIRLLMRLGGAHLPRLDAVPFDTTVAGFIAALIVITGVVVGLVPALRMADGDIASLMNETSRTVRGSRKTRRLLAVFVVAEIAVAVALVAGAVRFARSYEHLQGIDPGFDPQGRLVLDVQLPGTYLDHGRQEAWWRTTVDRLRGAGATRMAAASSLPLQHEWDTTVFADIVSRPDIPPDQRPNGRMRLVSPGFLSTMGIRLMAGRAFDDRDRFGSQIVAIVNEAYVRRFLGNADPLRERLTGFKYRIVDGRAVPEEVAIVGVAADVRYSALTAAPEPVVYVPVEQYPGWLRRSIVVTSADGHPERLAVRFKTALREIDPNVTVDVSDMSTFVASSLERQRLGMWLMSGFGSAALLLALVGVFGVVAYVAAQRRAEMAIRQALGATRAQVFWIVVRAGGRAAAFGLAAGLLMAWWTGRLIDRYVYEVSPADPVVLAGSLAVVGAIALCATLLPARRAARLDPVNALRG